MSIDLDYGEEWYEIAERFEYPYGDSCLHPETRGNPRNLSCPTCGAPNRLTAKDRANGYQCDECTDRAEGGGW